MMCKREADVNFVSLAREFMNMSVLEDLVY